MDLHTSKDAIFAQILKEAQCPTPPWRVKTMILGCIGATHMVSPSKLLDLCWQGNLKVLDGMGHAKEFFTHIMAKWNELAELQQEGTYQLWTVEREDTWLSVDALIKTRQEEIAGFIKGLDAGGTIPEKMLPDGYAACRNMAEVDALFVGFTRVKNRRDDVSEILKMWDTVVAMDSIITDIFMRIVRAQQARRAKGKW